MKSNSAAIFLLPAEAQSPREQFVDAYLRARCAHWMHSMIIHLFDDNASRCLPAHGKQSSSCATRFGAHCTLRPQKALP